MAGNGPSHLIEPIAAPQHFAQPTARELRAQSVHRLQIGLFGMCAMLLIVGLANIIMDRARMTDSKDPIEDVVAIDAEPQKPVNDSLAEIGVAPAANPTPTPSANQLPSDTASGEVDLGQ